MAFESLSEKLNETFKRLRGKGRLTEADVREGMREVRLALLEADVSYKVVKDFVSRVTERAIGSDVLDIVFSLIDEVYDIVMASGIQIVVFLSAAHAAVDSVRRKFFDFFAPHVRRGLTDFCKEGIYAHVELIGKHAEIKGFQSLIRS